ncbi:uncharacterized protein LOC121379917 isoform X2 [Gigantopelta aegis]|uniref:uncharacterized protein LOC121379917 isoform X2 n=1 Tax=Gigantopelta aegis TaxID=1735272 RepID=UPI001B888A3C|nr:uncharacterized protein LOC121379917 isoform X2 [Gigantopelta aegis]
MILNGPNSNNMTASNTFRCFNDICDEYSQYCVKEERRCYDCKDFIDQCNSTTGNFPSQCTRFCAGASDSYEVPFFVASGLGLAFLILVVVLIVVIVRIRRRNNSQQHQDEVVDFL